MHHDLTPTDEELAPSFERFQRASKPRPDDLTYLVIRTHMLFEELLRDFLSKQFKNPRALEGARLSFIQVLKLSQAASATLAPDDWRWNALKELNRLRNLLAHEFESGTEASIVANIVNLVGSQLGSKLPRLDQMPRDPDTGAIQPKVFELALNGLYAVLCVRLGFDANMRLIADGERGSQFLGNLQNRNNA